jgi:hypothetical protein
LHNATRNKSNISQKTIILIITLGTKYKKNHCEFFEIESKIKHTKNDPPKKKQYVISATKE